MSTSADLSKLTIDQIDDLMMELESRRLRLAGQADWLISRYGEMGAGMLRMIGYIILGITFYTCLWCIEMVNNHLKDN